MRIPALALTVATIVTFAANAQVPGDAGDPSTAVTGPIERGDRLALAVSNPDYPVTPGDSYELSFTAGGQLTTSVVTVESDRSLNLNLFGEVDTSGMTYSELKRQVETAVREAYPRSLPSFRLVSIGLFEVTVRGAIAETAHVTAWGLSRLSDVVQPLAQPYSSTRRVFFSSPGEGQESYDVFRATALGDSVEDPYVRPGVSVRIPPVGPLVRVRGEVNRPGRYEIIPGETLADAIEFAGGFSPDADERAVRLGRRSGGRTFVRSYSLAPGGDGPGPALLNGDQITVGTEQLRRPLIFIEGALVDGQSDGLGIAADQLADQEDEADNEEANYLRITDQHHGGLMLSDVLSAYRTRFAGFADLARTSVIRAGGSDIIEVDGSALLYGYEEVEDVAIEPFDTIFIPSRRISVLVTGPVAEPGLYLYVPGQRPEYYIRRAGGYDREISSTGRYTVYSSEGEPRKDATSVEPGDRIEVERNNFVYQFNRHFPVILSGLSLVTTVISVLTLINQ